MTRDWEPALVTVAAVGLVILALWGMALIAEWADREDES